MFTALNEMSAYDRFPKFRSGLKNGVFQPISYNSYVKFFKKWIEDIGMNKDLYRTHNLRSCLSLDYYYETGDLAENSKIFSHNFVKTTMIYIDRVAGLRAVEKRNRFNFDA